MQSAQKAWRFKNEGETSRWHCCFPPLNFPEEPSAAIPGSITLDGPPMEAYSGIASMNDNMSGGFPTLAPGMNAVSWSGPVAKIEVLTNWRYLL